MKKKAEKIVKAVEKAVKEPKKERLVALRNVAKMKAAGWEEKKAELGKHGRMLGVKVTEPDVVLMEK